MLITIMIFTILTSVLLLAVCGHLSTISKHLERREREEKHPTGMLPTDVLREHRCRR